MAKRAVSVVLEFAARNRDAADKLVKQLLMCDQVQELASGPICLWWYTTKPVSVTGRRVVDRRFAVAMRLVCDSYVSLT